MAAGGRVEARGPAAAARVPRAPALLTMAQVLGACAHSVSYAVLGLCFERVLIGSLGFQQRFQGQNRHDFTLEFGPVAGASQSDKHRDKFVWDLHGI